MEVVEKIDYGPLERLIGSWKGADGMDIAPEPDGTETSPYYETMTCTPVGIATNAEKQNLAAIHYHLVVYRKSNDLPFHNQTGYWMWEAETGLVMHSFTIPRAVSVLAAGNYAGETDGAGRIAIEVAAKEGDPYWGVLQSQFMKENARTLEFRQKLFIGKDDLVYDETTVLDIYGRRFDHTDGNRMVRD